MESNQCENKESEELNFRKMKSMSLVSFPKRKKKEEKEEQRQYVPPRNRCLSYAFPKNFVPKLHPKKARLTPTPIILNKNKKHLKPLKPLNKIEETLSLSFERKDSSDSMNDSSDSDENFEIRLNIQEAENNQKYKKMRRLMSKFTINRKQHTGKSKDDSEIKMISPSERVFNNKEKESYIQHHFKSFRHTFDCFKGTKSQRGFSIMNILEMTSGLK